MKRSKAEGKTKCPATVAGRRTVLRKSQDCESVIRILIMLIAARSHPFFCDCEDLIAGIPLMQIFAADKNGLIRNHDTDNLGFVRLRLLSIYGGGIIRGMLIRR